MDNTITFTLAELVGAFLAVCAGITCFGGALGMLINWVKKLKAPTDDLAERISAIELKLADEDRMLIKDNKRIEVLEEGNRVTQRALLALLSHGIDGNDVDSMETARKELQEYLILR